MDEINNIFEGVSSKQWKQKIQYELNGSDYNSIIREGIEQIPVKPFYHFDEKTPGHPEIARKTVTTKISTQIYVANSLKTAKRMARDIESGITHFVLIIPNTEINCIELLEQISLQDISVFIKCQFLTPEYCIAIQTKFKHQNVVILNDPIAQLTRTGNWFYNYEKDFETLLTIVNQPNSTLSCDITSIQNSGGTIIQQVGMALAHCNEYFNCISNTDINVVFEIAIGGNYFFEIAKIKALRLAYQTLAAEYGLTPSCYIFAQPSKRNKTWIDHENNTIRTTTESLSALIGGVDAVAIMPNDFIFKKENTFSNRLAKNQLLILLQEFDLNLNQNPTEGAYYLNYLTHQIAQKSLLLFKEIERKGGYLQLLKSGDIQKRIQESATIEQDLFDQKKITLVGGNIFIDQNLTPDISTTELYPFSKIKPRKTIIKPFIEKRLTESIEKKRANFK